MKDIADEEVLTFPLVVKRVVGIPLMIVLYLSISAPLSLVIWLDWAFDKTARWCGYDPRFWPLPKGQDESLRMTGGKCLCGYPVTRISDDQYLGECSTCYCKRKGLK